MADNMLKKSLLIRAVQQTLVVFWEWGYMCICQDKPTDIYTPSAHLNITNNSKNITNTPQKNQKRFQGDFSLLRLTGYLTSFK